jgi:hypothetical protein
MQGDYLSHEDFVTAVNNDRVSISLNSSRILNFIDENNRIGSSIKGRLFLLKALSLLFLAGGLALLFITKWYWALLVLFISQPLFASTKNVAKKAVVERAIEDESVYYSAIRNKIMALKIKK